MQRTYKLLPHVLQFEMQKSFALKVMSSPSRQLTNIDRRPEYDSDEPDQDMVIKVENEVENDDGHCLTNLEYITFRDLDSQTSTVATKKK